MKKTISIFLILSFIFIFFSCVTLQDRTLTPQEMETVEIIGTIKVNFLTMQPGHYILKKNISKKAYSKLLRKARDEYGGNIDIVNITADGAFSPLTILNPFPPVTLGVLGNFQWIRASGNVIMYGSLISPGGMREKTEDAVKKVSVPLPLQR